MIRLLAVDKPPTCAGEWLMPPGEKSEFQQQVAETFPLQVRDLQVSDLGRVFHTIGNRGVLKNWWFDGPESGTYGVVTSVGIAHYFGDHPFRWADE